jgi:hypothetical protein
MAEGQEAAAPSTPDVPVAVFEGGGTPPPEAPVAGSTPAPDASPAPKDAPEGEAKPWWQTVGEGKYKSEEEAVKGFSEFGKTVREKAAEAKAAAEKAASLEEWKKGVEPMFGAPVGEDGKPAPYELKLPDGVELDPTIRKGWEDFLREKNLSPAVAQEAFDRVILPIETGRELGQREYERARTIEALGGGDEAVASAAATAAFAWAAQALGDDEAAIEDLRECGGVGAAINTIARLAAKATNIPMGTGSASGAPATQAEIDAILADPRGMADPANAAKVEAFYKNQYPG